MELAGELLDRCVGIPRDFLLHLAYEVVGPDEAGSAGARLVAENGTTRRVPVDFDDVLDGLDGRALCFRAIWISAGLLSL